MQATLVRLPTTVAGGLSAVAASRWRPRRRTLIGAIIIPALALSAAGCGDDDADTRRLAAYCYATATLDNTAVFNAPDPESVKHEVAEARVALDTMRRNAPSDIAQEVAIVAKPFERALTQLEQRDFKPGSVDPSTQLTERRTKNAAEAIQRSTPDSCGVRLP